MHNAYQHLKISAKHYSLIRRPQGSLELQLKVIKCVTKGHVGKDGEERVAVTYLSQQRLRSVLESRTETCSKRGNCCVGKEDEEKNAAERGKNQNTTVSCGGNS